MSWPKRVKMYANQDKESASDVALKAGIPENSEAWRLARFALTELTCEVDLHEDGRAELVSVSDGESTLRRFDGELIQGHAFYDPESGRAAFMREGGDVELLQLAVKNKGEELEAPQRATIVLHGPA